MISIRHTVLLAAALLILPAAAVSQTAKPASAKGVWEAISFRGFFPAS